MLRSLLCIIGRHQPDRQQVRHDGHHYIGFCQRCGAPIWRKARGNWKRDRAPRE